MTSPIPIDAVREAADTIAAEAVVTPIVTSEALDARLGASLHCKLEAAQRTGSFKFRGAFNRLSQIPVDERPRGVVAVSSGNHGAAVACSAQLLGVSATIFIPDDAPEIKRSLIESFGAEIVTFERLTRDRDAGARQRVAETGATFIHPFDDPAIMAGQGTTGLELAHQVGRFDVLIVPISGGGLMAGCGSMVRALVPGCEIVGVEPEIAADTQRSFLAGERITIDPPPTIADGLAVTCPGALTFPINQAVVDDVVTVSESQIGEAMALLHETADLVIEPSGAVGIAAIAAHQPRWAGKRIAVILSGGNVDPERFTALTGRRC